MKRIPLLSSVIGRGKKHQSTLYPNGLAKHSKKGRGGTPQSTNKITASLGKGTMAIPPGSSATRVTNPVPGRNKNKKESLKESQIDSRRAVVSKTGGFCKWR
ncbi:hypothetical protein TNCV_3043761 [Trichonephila clavipes]|nr:hypothetical protein TNCV_3043761 [Trichonephila clavipes]